jgi:hypothetical protein
MRINEFNKPVDSRELQVKRFIKWTMNKLDIPGPVPSIELSNHKEEENQHHTGRFNTSSNTLYIYIRNRNLIDILRTVAHELTHYKQNLKGDLKGNQAYPGSPAEQEADAVAGYLIKIYGKKYPEILD